MKLIIFLVLFVLQFSANAMDGGGVGFAGLPMGVQNSKELFESFQCRGIDQNQIQTASCKEKTCVLELQCTGIKDGFFGGEITIVTACAPANCNDIGKCLDDESVTSSRGSNLAKPISSQRSGATK